MYVIRQTCSKTLAVSYLTAYDKTSAVFYPDISKALKYSEAISCPIKHGHVETVWISNINGSMFKTFIYEIVDIG